MKLKSSAFDDYERIPAKYTCDGEGVNPPLDISDVPEEAKSLALFITDPSVIGGLFTHWAVWNIAPDTKKIKTHSLPEGAVEGKNSFGKNKYSGPCPSTSTHVYLFKLYALDTLLPRDPSLTKKEIKKMMQGHILAKAVLKGFYERE